MVSKIIIWRLNEKMLAYEAATAWNRVISCNFSKHWSNCICFIYSSIFDLLYQRWYQRQYFRTLSLKVLAHEAATAWNRGIPCKFFKITNQIIYLVLQKWIKNVIRGEIFWDWMNLQAYMADTAWHRGIPCFFSSQH